MRNPLLALLALPLALAACGGGGATTGATPPVGGGGSAAATSDGMSNAVAVARGTVVDAESGGVLIGASVALAPAAVGAAPFARTTTDGNGTFALGAPNAGTFLLVVGSDSPSDTNRPTLHLRVTLPAGTTTVSGPVPRTYPQVTFTAPQSAGALRLTTLSSDERECLTAAQAGRSALKLPPLVEDELMLEDARAKVQEMFAQDTDTPAPMFTSSANALFLFDGLQAIMHSEQDFPNCTSWAGVDYSFRPSDPYSGNHPPYPQASSANDTLYGTTFRLKGNSSVSHASFGAQLYAVDPRT